MALEFLWFGSPNIHLFVFFGQAASLVSFLQLVFLLIFPSSGCSGQMDTCRVCLKREPTFFFARFHPFFLQLSQTFSTILAFPFSFFGAFLVKYLNFFCWSWLAFEPPSNPDPRSRRLPFMAVFSSMWVFLLLEHCILNISTFPFQFSLTSLRSLRPVLFFQLPFSQPRFFFFFFFELSTVAVHF